MRPVWTHIIIALLAATITGLVLRRRRRHPRIVIEDILKWLYHHDTDDAAGVAARIRRELGIRPRVLQKALQAMEAEQLIHTGPKGRSTLTQKGRDYALKIIRIHRLYEKYLAEKTGFHKREWHHLAEKMEHRLSSDDVHTMESVLGYPVFDPHGDPIPTATGELAAIPGRPLAELHSGDSGQIVHIEDEPPAHYDQILQAHIHIGSGIQVTGRTDSEIVFTAEGITHRLPLAVAQNITVHTKPDTDQPPVIRLSALPPGQTATIAGISRECRGQTRRRLLDLGFVPGATVRIALDNPLGDPIAYLIKDTVIALRRDEADKILITP